MAFMHQVKLAGQLSWQAISLPWRNKRLALRLTLVYLPVLVFFVAFTGVAVLYVLRQGADVAAGMQDRLLLANVVVMPFIIFFCSIPALRFVFGALDGRPVSWREAFTFNWPLVRDLLPIAILVPVLQLVYRLASNWCMPSLGAGRLDLGSLTLTTGLLLLLIVLVYWFFYVVLLFAIPVRLRVTACTWRTLVSAFNLTLRNLTAFAIASALSIFAFVVFAIVGVLGMLLVYLPLSLLGVATVVALSIGIFVFLVPIVLYFLAMAMFFWGLFVHRFLPAQ